MHWLVYRSSVIPSITHLVSCSYTDTCHKLKTDGHQTSAGTIHPSHLPTFWCSSVAKFCYHLHGRKHIKDSLNICIHKSRITMFRVYNAKLTGMAVLFKQTKSHKINTYTGSLFMWQLATTHCYCAAHVAVSRQGCINTINQPTGSNNQQLLR